MKLKHLITTVFAFVIGWSAIAQSSDYQKKADEMFSQFAYSKAIPLYEKMVAGNDNTEHALRRLAESHLLLRDFEKSIPYFERFIETKGTPSNYFLKYGMALKSVNKEKEALKWLKLYKKLNKRDKLVEKFIENGDLASVVFNSRERYEIFPVAYNSKYNDFGAIKYNGLTYFASSRGNEKNPDVYDWDNQPWLDIFYTDEDGKKVYALEEINSDYHESSLIFSTDHLDDEVMFFTRNNFFENKSNFHQVKYKDKKLVEKRNNLKIFMAKKDVETEEWKVVKNLEINSDKYSTGHPSINKNRTKLYFASDRPGGYGGTDIWYCDIKPRGGLGRLTNAGPKVNTPGNELFPFVNNEGKLFFASDGHVGYGQLDIFATITDSTDTVVDVINLGRPINSEKDDFAFFSNEDGTEGFISSNRKGGKGGDDIYKFDFTPSLIMEGRIFDAINEQPLTEVLVELTKDNGETFIKSVETDENGYFKMYANRDRNYTIVLSRKTHPNKMVDISTFNLDKTVKRITTDDIYMEPVLDVKVLAGLDKIYFDYNKSNIRPDAAVELDKVVDLMVNTYPYMTIRLESHTDPVGSYEFNDELSQERAKSTYLYLINNGVPKERILSYKGYGKRKPVNDCKNRWECPPKMLELNRRTEFPIMNILSPKTKGKKKLAMNK